MQPVKPHMHFKADRSMDSPFCNINPYTVKMLDPAIVKIRQYERKVDTNGGAKGRPETMCPCTTFFGIPDRQNESSHKHNVPALIHPVIMHQPIHILLCKMTGMYQCRDIVFLGRFILGTTGPQKICTGTHRFTTSHHPIDIFNPS